MSAAGQSWYMNIIRGIFAMLDRMVYGLIKLILFGIFDLAHLTSNSDVFSGIYSRIYVILGIFMAFKLSFSFFQYIVDPESMTGKSEKSISKLFMRIFVMLVALIFLPNILFGSEGYLSRMQNAFLPSVPKVLFGVNDIGGLGSGENFSDTIEQSSNEITVKTLSGFFAPVENLDEICGEGTQEKTPPITSLEEFSEYINLDCAIKGTGFLGIGASKVYKYGYWWGISTIVGVLIAALLLGITLDIAKRIFKLIILEVIAPIPIMSLIDPKSNKDGAFSKWVHSLITTFLDIFLKLGLVYIIIVLIHMIVNSGAEGGMFTNFPSGEGTEFRQTYLVILLILGLIFFAKEAPKFIKDALGIKGDGGSIFGDVKSIGKAAGLVGGAAVGVASAGVGNVASAASAFKNGHGLSGAMSALNTPGSMIAGAIRGGKAGFSGAGKNGNVLAGLGKAYSTQSGKNATKITNAAAGSTAFGRMGARASNFAFGTTPADWDKNKIDEYKAADSALKAYDDQLTASALKSSNTYTFDGNTKSKLAGYSINMGEHKRYLELAKQGNADAQSYLSSLGYYDVQDAESDYVINVEKEMKNMYLDGIKSGTEKGLNADLVMSAQKDAKTALKGVKLYDANGKAVTATFDGKNTGDFRKYTTLSTSKINNSKKHKARVQNAANVNNKKK